MLHQIVIPKKPMPNVLQELHNTLTCGYFGMAKTLGKVCERFYLIHCQSDVQEWCRRCDICSTRKGPPQKVCVPMAQYNVGSPIEKLAIYVLGPLPERVAGKKYVLVANDYFSK